MAHRASSTSAVPAERFIASRRASSDLHQCPALVRGHILVVLVCDSPSNQVARIRLRGPLVRTSSRRSRLRPYSRPWFVAECLDVDVVSQGESVDGVRANLEEALTPDVDGEELPHTLTASLMTPVCSLRESRSPSSPDQCRRRARHGWRGPNRTARTWRETSGPERPSPRR